MFYQLQGYLGWNGVHGGTSSSLSALLPTVHVYIGVCVSLYLSVWAYVCIAIIQDVCVVCLCLYVFMPVCMQVLS